MALPLRHCVPPPLIEGRSGSAQHVTGCSETKTPPLSSTGEEWHAHSNSSASNLLSQLLNFSTSYSL